MAGREDQPQPVVSHGIVDRGVEVALGALLAFLELVAELFVLLVEELAATKPVDGAMLGGGHEPGARVVRDTRGRPALQRRDQRVLREVFGGADIPRQAGECGDDFRRFDAPHRFDRAVRVGRRHRRASFCATRALTSFRTRANERGRSTVNWIVPLDCLYGASALWCSFMSAVPTPKRLQ